MHLLRSIKVKLPHPRNMEPPIDYLIVLNFRGTYFRGRRFRKVSREFIFADHKFLNI